MNQNEIDKIRINKQTNVYEINQLSISAMLDEGLNHTALVSFTSTN